MFRNFSFVILLLKICSVISVSILKKSTQKLGFEKLGVKLANFEVLRKTVSYCPSVLVEMGFMTNADEADYFLEVRNIKAMALTVLMGVMVFFRY